MHIPTPALVPIVIVAVALIGYCWYDIWRGDQPAYLPRWLWTIIVTFSVPLGAIVYLLIGRTRGHDYGRA